MVKKTYALKPIDAEKLVSYACRYRAIQTSIDELHGIMTVFTTFADNGQPTSIADQFKLELVSDEPPCMPVDEYRRRVLGLF